MGIILLRNIWKTQTNMLVKTYNFRTLHKHYSALNTCVHIGLNGSNVPSVC